MEQEPLRTTYNDETRAGPLPQVREAGLAYQSTGHSEPKSKERYRFERYGRRNWAVYDGEEMVAVTLYKKGASSVVKRLQNYELSLGRT